METALTSPRTKPCVSADSQSLDRSRLGGGISLYQVPRSSSTWLDLFLQLYEPGVEEGFFIS
jgi:hypothetical protein